MKHLFDAQAIKTAIRLFVLVAFLYVLFHFFS